MNTIGYLILAAVILAVVFFAMRKRKKTSKTLPPKHNPVPNPGKPVPPPAPPGQPQPPAPPPPESPEVLIDRNGRRPGDQAYDPRVDRPADEFSPPEPFGAYYGEGAFDPDGRWVGPDGVHWTDKHGQHHGP